MKRGKLDVKLSLLALVSAAVLSFGGVASAEIAGTKHDLSNGPTGTASVCVFCHTPHTTTSPSAKGPLWNRINKPGVTYTMYDSAVSSTMDMPVAGAPQGASMACLSCHDGATALDALINPPDGTWNPKGDVMKGSKAVGLGGDLTNDHPISVTYAPGPGVGQDPDFVALTTVRANGIVRLFVGPGAGAQADQVECSSCHDPHDDAPTRQPFLRASNTGSALCRACHIK